MESNLLSADDYNRMVAAGLTEEAWLQQVKRGSLDTGWAFYHTRQIAACPRCHKPVYCARCRTRSGQPQRGIALGSDPGFFDCVIAKPCHPIILAELKKVGGVLSDEQRGWIEICQCATGVMAGRFDPLDRERLFGYLTEGL